VTSHDVDNETTSWTAQWIRPTVCHRYYYYYYYYYDDDDDDYDYDYDYDYYTTEIVH